MDQASYRLRPRCRPYTPPRLSSAQHSSRASRLARRHLLRSRRSAAHCPGARRQPQGSRRVHRVSTTPCRCGRSARARCSSTILTRWAPAPARSPLRAIFARRPAGGSPGWRLFVPHRHFGIQLLAGCRCSADSPTATPPTGFASTTRSTRRAPLLSTRASRVPSSDSCTRRTRSDGRPRGSSSSSTYRTAPEDQPHRPRLRRRASRPPDFQAIASGSTFGR
jgi:hypothetical protein